jgi:hypothetical protein
MAGVAVAEDGDGEIARDGPPLRGNEVGNCLRHVSRLDQDAAHPPLPELGDDRPRLLTCIEEHRPSAMPVTGCEVSGASVHRAF